MNTSRTLRIAGIQVESRNFDVAGNLLRAEPLVALAAARAADLVLCPELLAAGYLYHRSIWDVAEPRGGATERWLASMARRYRIYIGASYLEASGDDFFNTFSLVKPDGSVAGRVRKEALPGFEGWYFRSCSGPKVIDTEIGRIGVGICWDNCTSRFLRRLSAEPLDLLLMPHSAPAITWGPITLSGQTGRQMLRGIAGFYARAFGIPTVMVNKAAGADSWSPIPCVPLAHLRFHYVGQSNICDAEGTVCDQLEEQPGVVSAEVVLNAAQKRQPRVPAGYWSQPPRWFPRISAMLFGTLESTGNAAYRLSRARRRAARDVQTRGVAESPLRLETHFVPNAGRSGCNLP